MVTKSVPGSKRAPAGVRKYVWRGPRIASGRGKSNARKNRLRGKQAACFLLLLITFSQCAFAPVSRNDSAGLSVAAYYDEKPLGGAVFYLVEKIEDFPERAAYSGTTDPEGKGIITGVKPGFYYLVAEGKHRRTEGDQRKVFSYFGGNPFSLNPGETLELVLPFVDDTGEGSSSRDAATVISGWVVHGGTAVEYCYIFAYSDPSSQFRDPTDALSGQSDESGYFEMDVLPGSYYLVGRKRKGGSFAGPLGEGDYFGYFPANPVTLGEGEKLSVTLPLVQLKMRNPSRQSRLGVATISGRIVDESGKAVAGAYAALYDNPELLNKPLFLSQATGQDGLFVIHVPAPGKYYLGARTGYGGAPGPGDLYGRYEGTLDHSVEIRAGDALSGVTIGVAEVW